MIIESVTQDRALAVLKAIVERYIRDGQPVGSKAVAEETSETMSLSAASIRHIMSDLEKAGYLQSPHTSAGRIPTVQGYRLFVNSLLTIQPLEEAKVTAIREQLKAVNEPTALVEQTSNMLSHITQLAGVVTLPKWEHFILKQIEFLPLSQHRILAIIIFNDQEIQNRIIEVEQPYSRAELQEAGNYLTQVYSGKDWVKIRREIYQGMNAEREDMQAILKNSLDIVSKAFTDIDPISGQAFVLAGQSNLLTLAEEAGISRLRSLFQALSQKKVIIDLLDACQAAQGIQIFIGNESGQEVFDDCSIVTAPYRVDGQVIGVLGVIGPTRMYYNQVISAVDVTSKLLSAALSD